MKNIKYLFLVLFSTTLAQNVIYDISSNSQQTLNSGSAKAFIDSGYNYLLGSIDSYSNRVDFENAVGANCINSSLKFEDFTNGPTLYSPCGSSISSGGDACFAPGELESGFVVDAFNNTGVLYAPPEWFGNDDALIGASVPEEFTIITFNPEVFAAALEIWGKSNTITSFGVFRSDGSLIQNFGFNTPIDTQTFFGVVSDEAIAKIQLESADGNSELFGNLIFGANCSLSLSENLQKLVSIFPNPTSNVLFVQTPSQISIDSVQIFDALGKIIDVSLENNQINTSNLNSGIYFLQINTNQGQLTKKFIKK